MRPSSGPAIFYPLCFVVAPWPAVAGVNNTVVYDDKNRSFVFNIYSLTRNCRFVQVRANLRVVWLLVNRSEVCVDDADQILSKYKKF